MLITMQTRWETEVKPFVTSVPSRTKEIASRAGLSVGTTNRILGYAVHCNLIDVRYYWRSGIALPLYFQKENS